jgi:hypothetical protein
MNTSVELLHLPKVVDERGNLTFLQAPAQVPFDIQRVFWTYGVPGGETRGGHAYKTQQEIIIALSGSYDVVIRNADGTTERYHLNRSYYGLFVPQGTWRHMENFSTNALSLHLSSAAYSREDYIYDWEEFTRFTK